jgi:hypothetical protein
VADAGWIHEIFAAFEARDGERAASFFAEDGRFEIPAVDLRVTGRDAFAKIVGG